MIPLEYFGYGFWICVVCLVWGAVGRALLEVLRERPSRVWLAAWRWARREERGCPQMTQIFADGNTKT